jgi:hypothetical protein
MVIFIDTENQWRMEGGTRKGRTVSFEPRHFHALFLFSDIGGKEGIMAYNPETEVQEAMEKLFALAVLFDGAAGSDLVDRHMIGYTEFHGISKMLMGIACDLSEIKWESRQTA